MTDEVQSTYGLYHIGKDGAPHKCRAKANPCRYSAHGHYKTFEEADAVAKKLKISSNGNATARSDDTAHTHDQKATGRTDTASDPFGNNVYSKAARVIMSDDTEKSYHAVRSGIIGRMDEINRIHQERNRKWSDAIASDFRKLEALDAASEQKGLESAEQPLPYRLANSIGRTVTLTECISSDRYLDAVKSRTPKMYYDLNHASRILDASLDESNDRIRFNMETLDGRKWNVSLPSDIITMKGVDVKDAEWHGRQVDLWRTGVSAVTNDFSKVSQYLPFVPAGFNADVLDSDELIKDLQADEYDHEEWLALDDRLKRVDKAHEAVTALAPIIRQEGLYREGLTRIRMSRKAPNDAYGDASVRIGSVINGGNPVDIAGASNDGRLYAVRIGMPGTNGKGKHLERVKTVIVRSDGSRIAFKGVPAEGSYGVREGNGRVVYPSVQERAVGAMPSSVKGRFGNAVNRRAVRRVYELATAGGVTYIDFNAI